MRRQEIFAVYAGLGVIKLILIILAVTIFMAGCASTDVPPAKVVGPQKYLMTSPKPFPQMKEGDDAVQKLAEAAEVHNRNARKIRGLQGYIKTVRKE